ncbi:MAG: aspartate kinase [Acholeplasmatales bacterium]|nr:aspartate kinase [Acholeplasmatales bacterium]
MIVITKFGGSSLSSAKQFAKVKKIIKADDKRKVVVCSALGKRNKEDSKITDLLYILHAHLKYKVSYDEVWNVIYSRFTDVERELKLDINIAADLDKLKSELNKDISEEYLVSRGEYLTSKLMAAYLGFEFCDSKDLLKFNYDGKLDEEATGKNIQDAFEKNHQMVVPGFYGSYPNGQVKLLSRGGSDITGSILAKYLGASVYENWTDVSGILAADPKVVENPKAIKEITYTELRELSYMGASVLHEETIFPVQSVNIPINLRNTNEPDNPGTLIKNVCEDTNTLVTGIAGKTDFISFDIYKDHMSNEVGFLRKAVEIFEKFNVSIEHIPSGIDSFSVVVSKDSVEKYQYDIIMELKNKLGAEVNIVNDISLVAVVGRNMAKKSGICAKIFETLGSNVINVRLLAQGPSELNIIIGVAKVDYKKTINCLYNALLG